MRAPSSSFAPLTPVSFTRLKPSWATPAATREEPRSVSRTRVGWVSSPVALASGFLTSFTVSLVGEMPIGELMLIMVAAFAVLALAMTSSWPSPLWRNPLFVGLMVCQGVAFIAYVGSDLVRGSLPHDMARGWARMVFLVIDIAAVAYLTGRSPLNFLLLLFGIQAGCIVGAISFGPLFNDMWKFGIAIPVTIGVFALFAYGGLVVAGLAAVVIGLINFAMDFRSLGLVCFLVAAMTAVQIFPRSWRSWVTPVGLVFGLLGVAVAYQVSQASRGGDRSDRSNVERSAMVQAAAEAFLESPVIGHGSWFSRTHVMDNFLVIREENAKLAGVGGFAGANEQDDDHAALHSQVLVTLAEGGLFGGTFFLAYIGCLVWALLDQIVVRAWSRATPLRLFLLTMALLHAFLSPFSGAHRVLIALAVTLLVLIHQEHTERARLANTEAGA